MPHLLHSAQSRIISAIGLAALFGAQLFWFQNCTPTDFHSQTAMASASKNGGDNYDGKLFDFHDLRSICADQSTLQARILRTSRAGQKSYSLLRENCTDLKTPKQVPEQMITVDSVADAFVLYAGRAFSAILESPIVTPTPRPPNLSCPKYEFFPAPINARGCESSGTTISRNQGSSSDAELYVFGMYNVSSETHDVNKHYMSKMDVYIPAGKNRVHLVLSAYEPTTWLLSGATDRVDSVSIVGNHCQQMTGVSESKVEIRDADRGLSVTLINESNLKSVMEAAEQRYSVRVTKAQYSYDGICIGRFVASP